MVSQESVGPGGGRNKLVAAARNEIVASFDDDSYPIDADYFARVQGLFEQFPDASILSAAIYERGQPIGPDAREAAWVSDFSGCACAYRRADFLGNSRLRALADSVRYGGSGFGAAVTLPRLSDSKDSVVAGVSRHRSRTACKPGHNGGQRREHCLARLSALPAILLASRLGPSMQPCALVDHSWTAHGNLLWPCIDPSPLLATPAFPTGRLPFVDSVLSQSAPQVSARSSDVR